MNRAKDKVINHLSHELKTPGAVLSASLNILSRKLERMPDESWKATMGRAKRNLDRIMEIQYQVSDIMRGKDYRVHTLLSMLLDQIADELETLLAEKVGEGPVVEDIRKRIDDLFGPKEETAPREIQLDRFVKERLDETRGLRSDRNVELQTRLEPSPPICIPPDSLSKVVDGLIRNAVENTPDEGKVEITVKPEGDGTELHVSDCGVGITQENQRRIFEGFFTTHETMDYSSKRPYDFRAGGKGADLLRTKIFSERYGFRINMSSSRCRYIPTDKDVCPGVISECSFCKDREDCYHSGGTTFTLFFPPVPAAGCS
jgi:signal transduction histidine kinase